MELKRYLPDQRPESISVWDSFISEFADVYKVNGIAFELLTESDHSSVNRV